MFCDTRHAALVRAEKAVGLPRLSHPDAVSGLHECTRISLSIALSACDPCTTRGRCAVGVTGGRLSVEAIPLRKASLPVYG